MLLDILSRPADPTAAPQDFSGGLFNAPVAGQDLPRNGLPVEEAAERLRALRKQLAADAGHSAFVVFPNATLEELARRQPCRLSDLEGIAGFGPKRVEAYGQAVVGAMGFER